MIANDGLVSYRSQGNGKYSFGYIGDEPQLKKKVCDGIQEEYRRKKQVVDLILDAFKECSDRFDTISVGPVCRGNPEIFTESECRPPYVWEPNVLLPSPFIQQNSRWYEKLKDFHEFFMEKLIALRKILDELEQYDTNISLDRINTMMQTVNVIHQKLKGNCIRFQRHMLLIPTFTADEIADLKRADAEKEAAARAVEAAVQAQADGGRQAFIDGNQLQE
jgi:hypothetical protein